MSEIITSWRDLDVLGNRYPVPVSDINEVVEYAIKLAEVSSNYGLLDPEKPGQITNYGVGAVLVVDLGGQPAVIMEGMNSAVHISKVDNKEFPAHTDGHAESNLLRRAERRIRDHNDGYTGKVDWSEGALLVSAIDPCHLCGGALMLSGMPTVYAAADSVIPSRSVLYGPGKVRDWYAENIVMGEAPKASGMFEGQTIHPDLAERALDVFETSAQAVRAWKKANQVVEVSPIDIFEDSSLSNKLLIQVDLMQGRQSSIVGKRINVNTPEGMKNAVALLAEAAIQAKKEGLGDANAALIIDPNGNVLQSVHDRTDKKGVMRTPVMRSITHIEDMRDSLGGAAGLLGNVRDFTLLTLREPNEMEYGRLANVYGPKVAYMQKDSELGIVTTGAAGRMHEMYQDIRGMNKSLGVSRDLEGQDSGIRAGLITEPILQRIVQQKFKDAGLDTGTGAAVT